MEKELPRTELNVTKEKFVAEIKSYLKNGRYYSEQSSKWFKECLSYLLSPNRGDKISETSSFVAGYLKGAVTSARYKKPWIALIDYCAPKLKLSDKHQEETLYFLINSKMDYKPQTYSHFSHYNITNNYDIAYNRKIFGAINKKLEEKNASANIHIYYEFMKNYAQKSPRLTSKFINDYAKTLFKMSNLDYDNSIKLEPFYNMICRKAKENPVGVQQELFSEISTPKPTIDKKALLDSIDIFADVAAKSSFNSSFLLQNYTRMMHFAVVKHSFNREDIKLLSDKISQERDVKFPYSKQFAQLAQDVQTIYNHKQNKEISNLNDWAFANNSDNFVEKLSIRSSYINILHEKLIKDNDISHINPDEYLYYHKKSVQKQIADLTGQRDKQGKIICRPYAINKVYKLISSQDKPKLENIEFVMQKLYKDSPLYNDVCDILSAYDGGEKGRDIKIPRRDYFSR